MRPLLNALFHRLQYVVDRLALYARAGAQRCICELPVVGSTLLCGRVGIERWEVTKVLFSTNALSVQTAPTPPLMPRRLNRSIQFAALPSMARPSERHRNWRLICTPPQLHQESRLFRFAASVEMHSSLTRFSSRSVAYPHPNAQWSAGWQALVLPTLSDALREAFEVQVGRCAENALDVCLADLQAIRALAS